MKTINGLLFGVLLTLLSLPGAFGGESVAYDVVIVGGTPGGIMAAVAAARGGCSAVLLERTEHIGGLPANGLGATDISTRGATAGLFLEFVNRVKRHYVENYGPDSKQAADCSDGYHFEPHVAERVFEEMLAEQSDRVRVLRRRQFDALPENVTLEDGTLKRIRILCRDTNETEEYIGRVFIDATYEGDLAAAAGVPYVLGREGKGDFNEPMAGQLYKEWGGPVREGSTGLGDNAVQAYNFRLCLTTDPDNQIPVPKPETYNREEYVSLIEDVRQNRATGKAGGEMDYAGIGRITNMVKLPNGKVDGNNQHQAFLSTDLPEENWPWPTSGWDWRDRFAKRQKEYTLGLLWFAQNDPDLPEEFRERCRRWGLAKDEYTDNGNFPRQVYVREGRRIVGDYFFTAHDALPVREGARPPVHRDSITASHYALDSHAVRKREPGRAHLDGFFSHPSRPYTVPYGVIVPKKVEGLLTPVPVSGTHIGFSTLRMEPCWMALGQAAGAAASLSVREGLPPRKVDLKTLQAELVRQGAVLMYFKDARPGDEHYEALQYFALRGILPDDAWEAKLSEPVEKDLAKQWLDKAGVNADGEILSDKTRGEMLAWLYEKARNKE